MTNKRVKQRPATVVVQQQLRTRRQARRRKTIPQGIPSVQIATEGAFEENSCAGKVINFMNNGGPLSDSGMHSLEHILNPCGTHSHEGARFPDGTLSQSGILAARLFSSIVPPWLTTSVIANTTANWSLFIASFPGYSGVGLLIAGKTSQIPSPATRDTIFNTINTEGISTYPTWDDITTLQGDWAVSYLRYPAAKLDLDPISGQSRNIESFRIVGDGFVIQHNCPTLWDQGTLAVGQFQTDFEPSEAEPIRVPVITEVTRNATSVANLIEMYVLINGVRTYIARGVNIPLNATGATFTGNVIPGGSYTVVKADGANFVAGVNETYLVTVKLEGTNNVLDFTTTTTEGDPFKMTVAVSSAAVDRSMFSTSPVLGSQDTGTNVLLDVASIDPADITQADPKWSGELMKKHGGLYAVRRYFQPKLLMQRSNVSGSIKLLSSGLSRPEALSADGGIDSELLDNNGATIMVALVGLSYAAVPQIKACRFIEFLPAVGSPLAGFVTDTPAKDDDAEEIFRQIQLSGPHSYIPDANALGLLTNFIHGVVAAIPMALRGARSFAKAIDHAAEWFQEKFHISE